MVPYAAVSPNPDWLGVFQVSIIVVAGVLAITVIVAGLRAGIIQSLQLSFGGLRFQLQTPEREFTDEIARGSPHGRQPFETDQVARYYAQVLAQNKISFWFSLVFAALGFVVIVAAAFLYTQDRTGSTIASGVAGLIMEAVSGLFFVQSKNAQVAMGEFFEKLRKDRLQFEAREMVDQLTSHAMKEAVRLNLAIFYSGIENPHEVAKSILRGHPRTSSTLLGRLFTEYTSLSGRVSRCRSRKSISANAPIVSARCRTPTGDSTGR